MLRIIKILSLIAFGALAASAYTFTDVEGRQFEGSVIAVDRGDVSIRRGSDGSVFRVSKARFCQADQVYFEQWSGDISERSAPMTYRLAEGETIRALPRQLRIDLIWERSEFKDYEVQRSRTAEGEWETLRNPTSIFHLYSDYIGQPGERFFYRVRGVKLHRNGSIAAHSDWSQVVEGTTLPFEVNSFVEEVQEAGVRFFFERAHPDSGLSPEGDPGWGDICAVGSTGMGMTNIVVGVHRGFVSRAEGRDLALKMLRFLDTKAERHGGAFGHWMDGASGRIRNFGKNYNAVDLVETSFLIQGIILLREYFDADSPEECELRVIATRLSDAVQWDKFMVTQKRGPIMMWHWHPLDGFGDLTIHGFHEAMMPYILGIGSDTHPITPESFYTGWIHPVYGLGRPRTDFGIEHTLGRGIGWPLFFAHYSHIGFDPRQLVYLGKTYFEHFVDATRVHGAYAKSRADEFKGYDTLWGLAASVTPEGYQSNRPGRSDGGTIATTAALSSMPYLPEAVLKCMESMYLDYGKELWGAFGFYNAINPSRDWVAQKYIGIELGPIAPMIENHRSGLLWKLFMQAPEVKRAQQRIAAFQP
jgi:hypothetical protein